MNITGPFFDQAKKTAGQDCCWFLRYVTPKKNSDGTLARDAAGKLVLQRHRPYYASRAKAEADRPNIAAQHETAGSGEFLFDRGAALDYEAAVKLVGKVPLVEVARFWRLHHPEHAKQTLAELLGDFLAETKRLHGQSDLDTDSRHISDLKSRLGAFVAAGFGSRYPDTVSRGDILDYVSALPVAVRTKRNHKNALSIFFGWIKDRSLIAANPAGGIKRRLLGREVKKEIRFLSLEEVTNYLRAAERYAPELVAHEIVQLISGVRADDEMADFRAEFVLPQTLEVVIPAAVAKTGKREVINCLEKNFWSWWSVYGPTSGLLRPRNYGPRWERLRVLATVADVAEADRLARLPIKTLLRLPVAQTAKQQWPWNGRRRTFCTYHVAKHQSADRTALILRHRGEAGTLHNSYRGMGVTRQQGKAYFEIQPQRVAQPIRPVAVVKGIVRMQTQRCGAGAEGAKAVTADAAPATSNPGGA